MKAFNTTLVSLPSYLISLFAADATTYQVGAVITGYTHSGLIAGVVIDAAIIVVLGGSIIFLLRHQK